MKKLLVVIPIMLAMLTCLVPLQSKGLLIYVPGNREFWEAAQFEKMEVRFNDGFYFYITTHDVEHIGIGSIRLAQIVRNVFRRNLNTIATITHNHLPGYCQGLTNGDRHVRDELRALGFNGRFLVWYEGQFYNQ